MVTRNDFVARDREIEEVRAEIGADRLLYLTVEEMLEASRATATSVSGACTACFSGVYPTGDVSDCVAELEAERENSRRERRERREAVSRVDG
jgi:amidophosphoribosyltransferase